jgi:hypothetical protein
VKGAAVVVVLAVLGLATSWGETTKIVASWKRTPGALNRTGRKERAVRGSHKIRDLLRLPQKRETMGLAVGPGSCEPSLGHDKWI